MLHGKIRLNSEKGKGSRFMVEIPMQKADDVPEQVIQTYIHRKDRNLNVIAIDNDEVLLLMQKFQQLETVYTGHIQICQQQIIFFPA